MMTRTRPEEDPAIAAALHRERIKAQTAAHRGGLVALAVISVVVTLLTPWPGPFWIYWQLVIFALLSWVALTLVKAPWARDWHQFAVVSCQFLLLSFTLLAPNPLVPLDYPPQFSLRFGNFVYYFVLLAGLAYAYRPSLVVCAGISGAVGWMAGVLALSSLPGTVRFAEGEVSMETAIALQANPYFIDMGVRIQEISVLLITSGLLALAVARARAVALRQSVLAQERANLARYFPTKTAQLLAERNDPFGVPRQHDAAVLFADLVAFTTWSETQPPAHTITLLRAIHGRLTEVVFKHDGTLDKFIGDGLMATFGTPEPGPSDALQALEAALDMADAFSEWRAAAGDNDLPGLSIGVHYGPVVIGNIGTDDRLEFAVLGDTVNVASRLEAATRAQGVRVLASAQLIAAAARVDAQRTAQLTDRLTPTQIIALKGRDANIEVRGLP